MYQKHKNWHSCVTDALKFFYFGDRLANSSSTYNKIKVKKFIEKNVYYK